MTDDYWGPMPDDAEYPTPRERLDDGEAGRLRALLRRWLREAPTEGMRLYSDGCSYHCALCGACNKDSLRIPHLDGCIVGDTLKELGK